MAHYLDKKIGSLFGESAEIDIAEVAADLGTDVATLHTCLQRPVAGTLLFDVQEDELLETTVLSISLAFRAQLGASFIHAGELDEKRLQFKCLLAPAEMQRELADAIGGVLQQYAAAVPEPVPLGQGHDGEAIRAYRLRAQVPETGFQAAVMVAPMLGRLYWPVDAGRKVTEDLRLRRSVRSILFDFVVDGDWEHWLHECSEAGVQLTRRSLPDVKRIHFDDWSDEFSPDEESEEPTTPAVLVARFCAALIGAAHCLIDRRPLNDTQKSVVEKAVRLWREQLPTSTDFCYLPGQSERILLDVAQWQGGAVLTLAALKESTGQQLTGNSLRNLVPHYVVKEGAKWRRLSPLENPLAKAIFESLNRHRNTTLTRDVIREHVESVVAIPTSGELVSCIDWLLEKMIVEGLVEARLDGFVRVDIEGDIKEKRREVRRLQTDLKKSLDRLARLDQRRWISRRGAAEDIKKLAEAASEGPAGRDAIERVGLVRDDMRALLGYLEMDVLGAQQDIEALISDAIAAEKELNGRVDAVHAAWRSVLGQDDLLKQIREAVAELESTRLERAGEIDALARANDIYQRFAARRDVLQARLIDGGAGGPQGELARAVLAGTYQRLVVTYVEA
jgi:hypothetical protein